MKSQVGFLGIAQRSTGLLTVLLAGFAPSVVVAQQLTKPDPLVISLKSREFAPEPGIEPGLKATLSVRTEERRHVIVQFTEKTSHQDNADALTGLGIKLLDYIPYQAWLASVDSRVVGAELGALGIRAIVPYLPEDRIDPGLQHNGPRPHAVDPEGNLILSVTIFRDVPDAAAVGMLQNSGAAIIRGPMMLHDWDVLIPGARLPGLLGEDAVEWVGEVSPPGFDKNDGVRANLQADLVQSTPFNLDGSNIQAGQWESGHADETTPGQAMNGHDDFYNATGGGACRINVRQGAVTNHGTTVAGVLMGSGFSSDKYGNGGTAKQWRGLAPVAEIYAYTWPNGADEHEDAINTCGIDVSNNSWGPGLCPDNGLFGHYTPDSRKYDWIVTGKYTRKIPIVFASGNEQSCRPWRGVNDGGAVAKNTITVGAIDSDNDAIEAFSSFGPVEDGRLKPDCVAPGDESTVAKGIRTTESGGDAYTAEADDLGGTSLATPAVTGSAALLIQDYRAKHGGADPIPSTVKVLLLCGARDLGNPGPDFKHGYGAVDIYETINCFRNDCAIEDSVATDENDLRDFEVPAGTTKLRVMIVWDDPKAAAAANPALKNDLDLVLWEPNLGPSHNAWILNPAAGNEGDNATTGWDNLNNVEQVEVASPVAGTWTIRVHGANVPDESPQTYSLCARLYAPPVIAPIDDDDTAEGWPYTGPTPELTQGKSPAPTWELVTGPVGMTINESTGVVSWPNPLVVGSPHTITIKAVNAEGNDTESWQLTVTPPIPDIPTVSEWGLMVMTLLLLTAGTVVFGRRRRAAAA